jgi:hypothetical protein
MYERFTDRARKVMRLANKEAQRFNHEYIGTEHILLGLVKEGSGVAANVLKNLGIDLRQVRREVEKVVLSGPPFMICNGKRPQTPMVRRSIEYSIDEARSLLHNYVGTEHLLLGLLRQRDGVAGEVLTDLGLKLENVREEVVRLLEHPACKHPVPMAGRGGTVGLLRWAVGGVVWGRPMSWAGQQAPGVLAAWGLFFLMALAGAIVGAVVASSNAGDDAGAAVGAVAGGLLGSFIAQVGRRPGHRSSSS